MGLVLIITLVVVGPQRFPEVARQLARWIRNARAFTDEVMKDVRSAVDEIEQEVTAANDGVNPVHELKDLRQKLTDAASDASTTVSEAATLPPVPSITSATPPGADVPTDAVGSSTSVDEWAAVTDAETESQLADERRANS